MCLFSTLDVNVFFPNLVMFKMNSEAMRQGGYWILTSDLEVMEVEWLAAVAAIIRVDGYTHKR